MELTMNQRKGVTVKLAQQYRGASKKKKGEILNTLVEVSGYNRCYASYVLRHYGKRHLRNIEGHWVELLATAPKKRSSQPRPRVYDEPVKIALTTLWKQFNYMCGRRLGFFLEKHYRFSSVRASSTAIQ